MASYLPQGLLNTSRMCRVAQAVFPNPAARTVSCSQCCSRRLLFAGFPLSSPMRFNEAIQSGSEHMMATFNAYTPRTDDDIDHTDHVDHIDHTDHMDHVDHVRSNIDRIDHVDHIDHINHLQ